MAPLPDFVVSHGQRLPTKGILGLGITMASDGEAAQTKISSAMTSGTYRAS